MYQHFALLETTAKDHSPCGPNLEDFSASAGEEEDSPVDLSGLLSSSNICSSGN
jgi:hypothetical protein